MNLKRRKKKSLDDIYSPEKLHCTIMQAAKDTHLKFQYEKNMLNYARRADILLGSANLCLVELKCHVQRVELELGCLYFITKLLILCLLQLYII